MSDENPYKPPTAETRTPKSVAWRRTGLLGLSVMLVSMATLCGIGEFHHGGVSFRSATLALLLMGAFVLGTATLIGSGIGWLLAAALRRRRQRDLTTRTAADE